MALHGKKVTYSSHSSRAARAAHAKGDREFRTYDTSAIMPKKSPAPFICAAVVAVVVIAAVCFFAFRGCAGSQVALLAPGQSAEGTITEGETASSIGDARVAARRIGSSREFTDEVTRLEAASALIPGTYTFQGGSTPEELVRAIMVGPAQVGDTLAVPEDIPRAELSELVACATGGRITAEAFLAASENASAYAADDAFLESAGENSLEGFLFPTTYPIDKNKTAVFAVDTMLTMFKNQISQQKLEDIKNSPYDLKQIITMASIIEKESNGDDTERKNISSVIHNRLEQPNSEKGGRLLQLCSSINYIMVHDGISKFDTTIESPYNTYIHEGLTPGPICNPGLSAIKAAIYPADTDYYFFALGTDDKSHFFTDYNEHLRFINSAEYQPIYS